MALSYNGSTGDCLSSNQGSIPCSVVRRMKMEKEIKDFTIEIAEDFATMQKMRSYAEACKSRLFIKKETVAKAILAEAEATNLFWRRVVKTWPKYKGWGASWTRSGTVIFTKDE